MVLPATIRQIEAKALRKPRHPSRSKKLKDLGVIIRGDLMERLKRLSSIGIALSSESNLENY